ncbi:MAG: carbohydrate ABC transporter permease [Thermomicrobiales bacterium]|nr:carbohydrate ABC transporter permease [Thermomicrobiales bacterium]
MTDSPARRVSGKLALFIVLIAGALIALFPFYWMIVTSLKTSLEVYRYPPTWLPNPIAWSNYPDAFAKVNGRVFFNSAFFAITIVVLQGLVTTMGGFAFARINFPYRNFFFILYLSTLMIPPQVTLIPTFLVVVRLGWIDSYQGLIVPILAQGAFGTFLFRQFFLRLPNEMYEAARLDGANYWQQFWKFTLPLSRPVITAYAIITFLTAWKMYLWPVIVVRSDDLKVLPMVIAELSANTSQDRGVMMAAVGLSVLPILILYLVAQRWFIEGIAMTGQKG